ncbi:hypothetical protein TNCV_192301 [Trichonephila clavipes]|nr:hypothetical protein TNCV_192301 [Trichonephila clavipes]
MSEVYKRYEILTRYWFGKSMNAFVVNDLKVNKNTVLEWYMFCREVRMTRKKNKEKQSASRSRNKQRLKGRRNTTVAEKERGREATHERDDWGRTEFIERGCEKSFFAFAFPGGSELSRRKVNQSFVSDFPEGKSVRNGISIWSRAATSKVRSARGLSELEIAMIFFKTRNISTTFGSRNWRRISVMLEVMLGSMGLLVKLLAAVEYCLVWELRDGSGFPDTL